MRLKEYEELWADTLLRHSDNSSKLSVGPERLNFYHSQFHERLKSSLVKMFPRLNEHLAPDWETWGQLYFDQYPATDFEINSITKMFPKFLNDNLRPLNIPDYIPELASYEVSEFFVYSSDKLLLISSTDTLKVNPTLEISQFEYHIANWVYEAEKRDGPLINTPEKSSNFIAFTRDPQSNMCIMTELDGIDLTLISLLEKFESNEDTLIDEFSAISIEHRKISKKALSEKINFLTKQAIIY